jgi:metal transporter CNNM
MTPAPKARVQKGQIVGNPEAPSLHAPEDDLIDLREGQRPEAARLISNGDTRSTSPARFGTSPKTTLLGRSSSGADCRNIMVRGNINDMREHLKHLGPSNLASRPKTTRYNTVKIKSASQPARSESRTDSTIQRESIIEEPYRDYPDPFGGEGEGLLKSAGKDASDGVQALQQGYGSFDPTTPLSPSKLANSEQAYQDGASDPKQSPTNGFSESPQRISLSRNNTVHSESSDTVGSLKAARSPSRRKKAMTRSGSITENVIEAGGVRKVVLETTSSSSDKEDGPSSKSKENRPKMDGQMDGDEYNEAPAAEPKGEEVKKKRRRNRHKKKGGRSSEDGSTAGQ